MWYPVYTIQPVVKPVVQPTGWTNSGCSFNRLSNRMYNRFDNRFDNRLYTRYSRLSNRLSNGLNVCIHETTGCQTVWQPDWQHVVSCKRGLKHLHRVSNKSHTLRLDWDIGLREPIWTRHIAKKVNNQTCLSFPPHLMWYLRLPCFTLHTHVYYK